MTYQTVCPAESLGRCNLDQPARYIHDCTLDDGHNNGHECACGHRWTETDDSR